MHEGLLIIEKTSSAGVISPSSSPKDIMFCNKSAEKWLTSSINLWLKNNDEQPSSSESSSCDKIVQLRLFQPVKINESNSQVKKFADLCRDTEVPVNLE